MRGSIRTRLLAAFLMVAVLSAAGLSYYFLTQIEAYGLRNLETRLYTEARVSAALLGAMYEKSSSAGGEIVIPAKEISSALADVSSETSSRLRVLDAKGVVLADSGGADSLGSSYAARPEIAKALTGAYGADTRRTELGRVALYVAAPIRTGGTIVGATYASSTTFSILTLLSDYRRQLGLAVLVFALATFVLAEMLGRWLTRPLRELEVGASALAADHSVRVTPEGPREVRALAEAFNRLADDIENSSIELHEEERRKSRFVSDVSHELRTPLTAIRGAAETLMADDVSIDDRARFLSTIVSESDRLARLASDLLTLQRIEGATGELPLSRVDLRQVAAIAVEALEPVASERGVTVEVHGEAPAVLGDRDRIQQVVANLVDNATRFTPKGGLVTVTLSRDDDHAVIEIADTGAGIPEGDLPRLFDRFYRSELSRARTSGGAGLGLAIVRAIVTGHGGTIEAANRVSGGAVLTVRLPALKDEAGGR
ncbi:MAG: ATP-binding protein [Coriobacteriia bacterium]|nr:ATP-binding protein [Coriobacteriia bacterium]